jgi:hypothetical protein
MNCQDTPMNQPNDLGCLAWVLLGVGLVGGAVDGLLFVLILSCIIEIEVNEYGQGMLIGGGIGMGLAAVAVLVIHKLARKT